MPGQDRIVGVGSDVGPHFVWAPRARHPHHSNHFHIYFAHVTSVTSRSNAAAYSHGCDPEQFLIWN